MQINQSTLPTHSVLILGANGRFGQAASDAFAQAGWQVLAQARRAVDQLPSTARHLEIALEDDDALIAAAKGARVVVYAVNPNYTQWETQALALARHGMRVAEKLGATFMLPGNVYNFGAAMPELLLEHTPQTPTTRNGRVRCEMEAELQAQSHHGLRSVIIRAGDFYGAGLGSWLDLAVVKSMARGKLVYPGPLDVAHAWAYLPDLARCFVLAANNRHLPGFARLHFPGHTLTGAQLIDAVTSAAQRLGLAPVGGFQTGGMPWRVMRVGGLFVPMWHEVAQMQYLWNVPHQLSGSALQEAIGSIPNTPVDVAMGRSLTAVMAHGMNLG